MCKSVMMMIMMIMMMMICVYIKKKEGLRRNTCAYVHLRAMVLEINANEPLPRLLFFFWKLYLSMLAL